MAPRNGSPSKIEIKVEDSMVKSLVIEKLPENSYKTIINMNYDSFKYSDWYALVQDMKKYLTLKGFDDISAVEKGIFKVTTADEIMAKKFVDLMASDNAFGFSINTKEKTKLMEFLDLPSEAPKSLLVKLCWEGNVYDVDQILKHKLEKIEDAIDKNGHRPIHIAYLTKSKYLTETLLKHSPSSINQKNDDGNTVLSMAVGDGDANWYRFISGKNPNLDIKYEGNTLLDLCVKAFKSADELYHNSLSFDFGLHMKKYDCVKIAKDLAHKHPEWIASANAKEATPLYIAKSAHDQSLYNALINELHEDTGSGKSFSDIFAEIFGL